VFDTSRGVRVGAVRSAEEEAATADGFQVLDRRFPGRLPREVLRLAMEQDEYFKGATIAALAPHLAPAELERAVDAALRLPSKPGYLWDLMHDQGGGRETAISGLVPHLPRPLLVHLVGASRALAIDPCELDAAEQLAASLAADGDFRAGLRLIGLISEPSVVARWLASGRWHLTEDIVDEVFEMVDLLEPETLSSAASSLIGKLLDLDVPARRKLELVSRLCARLVDPLSHIEVLCKAAPYEDDEARRTALYEEVLQLLPQVNHPAVLRWHLRLERLPAPLQRRFLDWMLELTEPSVRVEVLASFAANGDCRRSLYTSWIDCHLEKHGPR
jgi:hypothetical protein